jgi:hypothetical protein
MIAWRLKTQTVDFRSACRFGWTMKHNGRHAISLLQSKVAPGLTGRVWLQNQNNKRTSYALPDNRQTD